jgi:hypothetical protein
VDIECVGEESAEGCIAAGLVDGLRVARGEKELVGLLAGARVGAEELSDVALEVQGEYGEGGRRRGGVKGLRTAKCLDARLDFTHTRLEWP